LSLAIGLKTRTAKPAAQFAARPPAAVEVTPDGVLAAALPGKAAAPVYAFAALPAGAVLPGTADANLYQPEAVAHAIETALGNVSPRTRSVSLVVPDTAARVFVLDFDSLPAKPSEALPILRFRLRKMVPFDVERAGLSYQVLSETKSECRVLASLIPASVLDEYESTVRAADYEPGAVLPSSLAALAALADSGPALTACLSGVSLTTAITRGDDLLLYRTLELPDEPAQRLAQVQRDLAVATAYFEDKLLEPPRCLHYAGMGDARAFANWTAQRDLEIVDLAPRPTTGNATSMGSLSVAAISGALAGAGVQQGAA
jgi:type IV pilus assembly protein PilM